MGRCGDGVAQVNGLGSKKRELVSVRECEEDLEKVFLDLRMLGRRGVVYFRHQCAF